MTATPRVSIIIVLYNGLRFIDRCLRSVLAQEPSGNGSEGSGSRSAEQSGAQSWLEVIVVDNASSDGGPEHVEQAFPSVRVVRTGANLGYAGGINAGLEVARGEYIAPLNADTEVGSSWLAPLLAVLEREPGVGAVTPMIVIDQDRRRVNAVGGAIHVTGLSFCKGLNREVAGVSREPFRVPGVSGASYVIRRERLERMGGAPAECFMGNDDVVLSWTLRLMGDDIWCVPESVVYHRYRLAFDPGKLRMVERNRQAMLLTSLEGRTLAMLAPVYVGMEAAILGYCLVKGPAWVQAKLGSMRDVWAQRGELRERRARNQRIRGSSDLAVLGPMQKGLPLDQLWTILGRTPTRHED